MWQCRCGVVWCIEHCLPYNIVHYEILHSVCLSTNFHSLYDVSNDSYSGVSSTDYIHFPIITFSKVNDRKSRPENKFPFGFIFVQNEN